MIMVTPSEERRHLVHGLRRVSDPARPHRTRRIGLFSRTAAGLSAGADKTVHLGRHHRQRAAAANIRRGNGAVFNRPGTLLVTLADDTNAKLGRRRLLTRDATSAAD